jgi:hypothetical protein
MTAVAELKANGKAAKLGHESGSEVVHRNNLVVV